MASCENVLMGGKMRLATICACGKIYAHDFSRMTWVCQARNCAQLRTDCLLGLRRPWSKIQMWTVEKLTGERLGEPSSAVSARVEAARERQHSRFAPCENHVHCNADMTPADVRIFCKLDSTGQSLMRAAMQQLQLSARAFHRVLKTARAVADIAGSDPSPRRLIYAILMAAWQESVFAFMARNSADLASFYHLPSERVIELGIRVELELLMARTISFFNGFLIISKCLDVRLVLELAKFDMAGILDQFRGEIQRTIAIEKR